MENENLDENLKELLSLSKDELNNIFSQLSASEVEALLEKVNEEDDING